MFVFVVGKQPVTGITKRFGEKRGKKVVFDRRSPFFTWRLCVLVWVGGKRMESEE